MKILFTQHVLLRMRQRAVSEDEVYEIFENPFLVREKGESVLIGKTNSGRLITLVMDITTRRLLTLWPASRKERRLYQEKQGGKDETNASKVS